MIGTDWIRPQGGESATCLEVRRNGVGNVVMRQTEAVNHIVVVNAQEWQEFIHAVKAGFYDGLTPGV